MMLSISDINISVNRDILENKTTFVGQVRVESFQSSVCAEADTLGGLMDALTERIAVQVESRY